MSNLTRGRVDLLMNVLSSDLFGHYVDGGVKHLVLKENGFDFVGPNTKAVIKYPVLGNKMKRTLTISFLWNGEGTQLFQIDVTREPLITSRPEEQFPVTHQYNFLMPGFTTTVKGTLNDTDKDTIIAGLKAAIEADVQLNANAILTGASVVATNVAHKLVLESKERGKIFTVRTYDNQFTQPVTPDVGFKKDALTNLDVAKVFSIKEEDVLTQPNIPYKGVDYACITVVTTSETPGIDLPSSKNNVEQGLNIYTPVSELEKLIAVKAGNNNATMAGASPDMNLIELIEYVFGAVNTNLDQIATPAIAGVTAPVKDAAPKDTVTETDEYTGVIVWTVTDTGVVHTGNFSAATAYTATITLTPKKGKTLSGVDANFFTVAGGLAAATNEANSGVVVVGFAATAA